MQIILSDFISLDGVVQAPGGQGEDPDGGFRHGGWSMPFFDEEAMGPVLGEVMAQTGALLSGRRTWEVMASAWPERAGDAEDAIGAIGRLRDRDGDGAIQVWGSASLALSSSSTPWSTSTASCSSPSSAPWRAERRALCPRSGLRVPISRAASPATAVLAEVLEHVRLRVAEA